MDEKLIAKYTKRGFTPNQIAIVIAKDIIMNLIDDPGFDDHEFLASVSGKEARTGILKMAAELEPDVKECQERLGLHQGS